MEEGISKRMGIFGLCTKTQLQARERGRMADRDDWYGYIYPQEF